MDSQDERDRLIRAMIWDYDDPETNAAWRIRDEPSVELIL